LKMGGRNRRAGTWKKKSWGGGGGRVPGKKKTGDRKGFWARPKGKGGDLGRGVTITVGEKDWGGGAKPGKRRKKG